jgi:O-antigen ligase
MPRKHSEGEVRPDAIVLANLPLRDLTLAGALLALSAVGFVLGLAGSAVLPVRYAPLSAYLPVAGALAGASALVIALRPKWVFYGFVFFCVFSYETLEEVYVPLGFLKLYIQDVVLVFNLAYVALRLIFAKVQHRKVALNKFVILYFVLGIFSTANGLLLSQNPYDRVFGDFRRSFVYFLNYFFVLYLIDNERERVFFRNLLVAACGALIGKGIFQILTGQFYYRRMGDAAHILSHIELTFLSFGVFYAVAHLFFEGNSKPWLLAYAFLGTIVTVIGNYRASWLGFAGGLFLIFLFLPARRRAQLTLVVAGLLVLAALSIYALWDVEVLQSSTLGQEISAKADFRNAPLDVNVIWRFDSYRAAMEYWRQRPWLGCGLGTIVDFATITTRGTPYLALDHRVHNSFIWLWMTQGILGFPIAMLLHIAFLVISLRYVRQTTWLEGKTTVLACAAYGVSMLISTAFEHFLETGPTITVYSAVIGLAILTIHARPPREETANSESERLSARL